MTEKKLKTHIQKNFAFILILSNLIIMITAVLFYYTSMGKEIQTNNAKTIKLLSSAVAVDIKQHEDTLLSISLLLNTRQPGEKDIPAVLQPIFNRHPNLIEILVCDRSGYVRTVVPENSETLGIDMSGESFFKQCLSTNQIEWSRAYLEPGSGNPTASLAMPFSQGVLMAKFDFSKSDKMVSLLSSRNNLHVALVDQGGIFIAHSDSAKVHQRQWEPGADQLRTSLNHDPERFFTSIDKGKWTLTGTLISKTGWLLILYQNQQSIILPARNLSLILSALLMVFFGLGIFLSLKVSSNFFNYFDRLMTNIRNVAQGNYNIDIPSEGFVEFQQIGDDFYQMTHQIKSRQREIVKLNTELETRLNQSKAAILGRKKAETALRISEERHRKVFEEARDGILLSQTDTGVIVDCNKAFADLVGRKKQELVGTHLNRLNPKSHPAPSLLPSVHRHPPPDNEKVFKKQLQAKNGTLKNVEIKASPLVLAERHYDMGIFRDISDRMEMERQLRQSQKMEAIGRLAGGIAHDFNNILGAIIGFTELSQMDAETGSRQSANLEKVLNASSRARDLISQILAFSRHSEKRFKPFSITPIVKETIQLMRATLPRSIEINTSFNTDTVISGDATQIHQVLMNLCTNAWHAMNDTGGVLDIELNEIIIDEKFLHIHPDLGAGPHLKLTIKDTGKGIEPECIEHIFEPFFSTKQSSGGTGMGLAVVHGIVKNHGGEIIVNSTPGQGAEFIILIPALIYESEPKQILTSAPVSKGSERILFVDDEINLSHIAKQFLGHLGYQVTTRTDSLAAKDLFVSQPDAFDMVITDMAMPGLNGEKLAAAILETRPDIPVIMCTGFSSEQAKETARQIGIKKILMKPVTMKNLSAAVRKTLDLYSGLDGKPAGPII